MAYENNNIKKIKDWPEYKKFLQRQATAGRKVWWERERVDPLALIQQLVAQGKIYDCY